MSKKSVKKKLGRPFLPPGEARVHMGVRVLPATIEALKDLAEHAEVSSGVVLDRLIAKEHKRVVKSGQHAESS